MQLSNDHDRVSGASACLCGTPPFPLSAPLLQWKLKRNGIFALLGYYASFIGSCVPTFRDNVSVPFSRSWTA